MREQKDTVSNLQYYQKCVENSLLAVANCVVPIFAEFEGKFYLKGSGVILRVGDERYLITASHVLECEQIFLSIGKDAIELKTAHFIRGSEKEDVSVLEFDKSFSLYSEETYLSQSSTNRVEPFVGNEILSVVGFPSTKFKTKNVGLAKAPIRFSMTGERLAATVPQLKMRFRRSHNITSGSADRKTAPKPFGMSGGAVFSAPVAVGLGRQSVQLELVGIAIEYHAQDRYILATDISAAFRLIG